MDVNLHKLLSSSLDEGEWLATHSSHFTLGSFWYPLDRKLRGNKSQSGHDGKKVNTNIPARV